MYAWFKYASLFHLIEACLVGTIPILSYNDFLSPKLTDNEALFYFNKIQLLKSINDALYMDKDKYDKMKETAVLDENTFEIDEKVEERDILE